MRTMAVVGTWAPNGRPDVRTAPPGAKSRGRKRRGSFMPARIARIIPDLRAGPDPA
jgi:hypothetical protein